MLTTTDKNKIYNTILYAYTALDRGCLSMPTKVGNNVLASNTWDLVYFDAKYATGVVHNPYYYKVDNFLNAENNCDMLLELRILNSLLKGNLRAKKQIKYLKFGNTNIWIKSIKGWITISEALGCPIRLCYVCEDWVTVKIGEITVISGKCSFVENHNCIGIIDWNYRY